MVSQLALLSVGAAYVQMDFQISNSQRSPAKGLGHKSLSRRAVSDNETISNLTAGNLTNSTVEPVINATLTSSYNFYHGKILVGSPAQEMDVLLDTGSPVTWFYGPEGSFNNASRFFPKKSSTFSKVNYSFSAAYGSGEYLGCWASDRVAAPQFVANSITYNSTLLNTTFNGANSNSSNGTVNAPASHNATNSSSSRMSTLFDKNNFSVPLEFGVVTDFATSAGAPGLLGLGPHIEGAGPKGYISLPEVYAKYNITSSSAFSMFLEENEGRFLFGGVDLAYVDLPLYTFAPKKPLTVTPSSRNSAMSWTIFLDSASVSTGNSTKANAPFSISSIVTLDTGSSVNMLPSGFVDAVGKKLGLTKYDKYETYYLNGTKNLPKGTINFSFNGLTIEADISNFLVPGEYIWLSDGPQNVTALSLMGSHNYLLGDGFFRSAYTVLDPATGNVILGKRSKALMNTSNSTNSSTVVPFTQLLNNSSAVVNGTSLITDSSEDITSYVTMVQTVTSMDGPGAPIPSNIAANQYLGSVDAQKAASITASKSGSSGVASAASSTGSSSAASSSSSASKPSSSSSSKKKNAAEGIIPSFSLALIMGLASLL